MNRSTVVLVLVALAVAGLIWLARTPAKHPAPAGAAATVNAPPASQAEAALRGSPLAAQLNEPASPPERDVTILRDLMNQYLTALQRRAGPPIGDDADLVRALTGRNPLKLTVIPANHPAISPDGRLLDRWGTPYHVHARSAQSFEFRSAGPDKKLFSGDDLVSP